FGGLRSAGPPYGDQLSEREVERLGDEPPEPPAERVRSAVDLGEAAEAGLEDQVGVLQRDDHLVNGVQRLGLAGLRVLLGRDLAPGRCRELGGNLLAVPLGDLADLALEGDLR